MTRVVSNGAYSRGGSSSGSSKSAADHPFAVIYVGNDARHPRRVAGAELRMEKLDHSSSCVHWQPAFETLLRSVPVGAKHGHLTDIREALRSRLSATRPLVILCPHADDGAITAACLMHEYATKRGLPVIEVLVFSGARNVDAAWLNEEKKVVIREREFRAECDVVGAEAVSWELDAYRNPGYQPSGRDIDKTVEWFLDRRPGAVIVPPATDAHLAHRMTRTLAAIGLLGARLNDALVLSGWTPWGPLPRPNAFFPYDAEAERAKEWAIHCHASQLLLTDYFEFCTHLGRAYAALTREWSKGHTLQSARAPVGESFVGVELFQIEKFDPELIDLGPIDPIQVALGILSGQLEPTKGTLVAQ